MTRLIETRKQQKNRKTGQTYQTDKERDGRADNTPKNKTDPNKQQNLRTDNEDRPQPTKPQPNGLKTYKKLNRTYQEQQKTKTPNPRQRTDVHIIPKEIMPHFIGKGAANLKRLTKTYQVTIKYETDGTIQITGTPTINKMTKSDTENIDDSKTIHADNTTDPTTDTF